jgi:hypothetical protein
MAQFKVQFGTQQGECRGHVWHDLEGGDFSSLLPLLLSARTSGHCVVYGLKTALIPGE